MSDSQPIDSHVTANEAPPGPIAPSVPESFDLFDSQHPSIIASTVGKGPSDKLEELHAITRTEPSKPDDLILPSSVPASVLRDPNDPLFSQWQRTLLHAFDNFGRVGIEREMYKRARIEILDPDTSKAHWQKIIDDENNEEHKIILLLQGLTNDAIRSIIRGTLIHDTSHNKALEDFVNNQMKPKDAPSIYCMYPARTMLREIVPEGRPLPSPNAGKWLSPVQARELVQTCRDYLNDSPTAQAMNQAIDRWRRSRERDKDILESDRSREVFREWLIAFEKRYCKNVDPNKATTLWTSVPFTVGFAVNTHNRLGQHRRTHNTGYIFAVVHAILMLHRDTSIKGFGFPETRKLELFPLWEDDEAYAQLGVIVGSLLGSSYWWDAGLNAAFAGTASLSMHVKELEPKKWDDQAIVLAKRIQKAQYPGCEFDRFNTLSRQLQALREVNTKKLEADHAEREYKKAEAKFETQLEKYEESHRAVGKLRKQLANVQEQRVQASQEPWAKEFYTLKKNATEENVVKRFVDMKVHRGVPNAYQIAMKAQDVPEEVRVKVETRRQANLEAAREKIQQMLGSRTIPRQPEQSNVVVDVTDVDLTTGFDDGAIPKPGAFDTPPLSESDTIEDDTGPEDRSEWGLEGMTQD
ncbi:MAG: hypothetical protein Q9166_007070 [cf. Caloplaca sp. 2 TL-2023]